MTAPQPLWKVVLAWCVHFYTALGLVAAAGIAVLLVRGGEGAYPLCFVLMFVATLIDATDGALARAIRIKEVLPGFDGRRLDDLIDFLTYTALPLLLVWRAGLVPEGWGPVLLLPLLASAYGFCQTHAKTEDGFFLGFPSYWNLVAFYFYVLRMPGWLVVALAVLFALLTFVPSRYLYPTQRGRLNLTTNVLGAGWAVLLIWILVVLVRGGAGAAGRARAIGLWSLYFPAYYLLTSWWISLRFWRRKGEEDVHPTIS
jgi:phosphatidylcholine synthase